MLDMFSGPEISLKSRIYGTHKTTYARTTTGWVSKRKCKLAWRCIYKGKWPWSEREQGVLYSLSYHGDQRLHTCRTPDRIAKSCGTNETAPVLRLAAVISGVIHECKVYVFKDMFILREDKADFFQKNHLFLQEIRFLEISFRKA